MGMKEFSFHPQVQNTSYMNSVTAWEKGILDDKSGGSHLYFYRGGIGCAD